MSLNIGVPKIKASPLIMAEVPAHLNLCPGCSDPTAIQGFPGMVFLFHSLCQLLRAQQRGMQCTGITGIQPPSAPHFCPPQQFCSRGVLLGQFPLQLPRFIYSTFPAGSPQPPPQHKQLQTLLQLSEFVKKPSTIPTAPRAHRQGTVAFFSCSFATERSRLAKNMPD